MEDFLREWGYLGILLGIIGTGAGLPMPEELPVVIGGVLAGTGHAIWWIMLPVCILAVIIGDSFLYMIGRYWGPSILQWSFVKKHILPPERLAKIEDNFHQYGIRILLFARLTPGIRAPIFLTAGIVRLPLFRFLIADGIYAVPGVSILFYLGYVFTEQMVSLIEGDFERVKSIIILVVVVGVVLYLAYRHLKKPVVTGDPHEMPKLAEEAVHVADVVVHVADVVVHKAGEAVHSLEGVASKMIHPSQWGKKPPPEPADAHPNGAPGATVPHETNPNGQPAVDNRQEAPAPAPDGDPSLPKQ